MSEIKASMNSVQDIRHRKEVRIETTARGQGFKISFVLWKVFHIILSFVCSRRLYTNEMPRRRCEAAGLQYATVVPKILSSLVHSKS